MTKIPPAPPPIQPRRLKQTSLSFSQESLWFLQQLDPENGVYHSTILLRFTGGINHLLLEKVLNALVSRHETLRTLYPNKGGRPIQVIQPFGPISLPLVDLSGLPDDEQEQAILKYVSEHDNQPFDLQRGPLLRYALLHISQNVDYLFFCTHHINFDAWSRQILISELTILYEAFRSGQEPTLPNLPIQYADYALWQREWLSGETLAAYLDHWKTILSGDLPILELPTDRPRPVLQTYSGARYHFRLPQAVSARIKGFCQMERMTPFQLLLAAYTLLLRRHTGQEDIIIGCPFANRLRPELDRLVGLFVNTLPIRVNLQGNPSVREFLKHVQALMLEAYPWQAAPFEALVSEISPQRDLSRTPVFQVTINMRNVPKHQTSIEGLEMETSLRDNVPSPFDLSLEFDVEEDGALDASLQYNVDLYDENTILHMVAHYQNLVTEMLAKCDHPISDLEMLTPSERKRMVVDWNATAREFPHEKSVPWLFEEQVRKRPDALAVIFGDKKASFSELNQQANQLARHLLQLGVVRGTFVGVCMERSLEMVVAMLAILKSGGAYVPLDPTHPAGRLGFMVQDTQIKVVVSTGNWADTLPSELRKTLRLVLMDKQAEEIAHFDPENPSSEVDAGDIAYVIYTSGSTGIPKGICIPQRAINRLVLNTDYIQITPNDRIAQASNMSFDAAIFEVWGALLNGARLVGVPKEILLSPEELRRMIREQEINILFLTTALFNQVASIAPDAFAPLRVMIFGGEAATPAWVQTVLKSGAPGQLIHAYGPTETTTYATWHLVREVADSDATVPIGMPIANTTAYVLDRDMHPVPTGVTGELFIGGSGLAVGYHNRTELTSERFIRNPFRQEEQKAGIIDNDRLYKTGDLVRRKPDGDIEFVGRMDNQIKLRGFRIELGEIEAAIGQYPGIHQAIVLVREDQPGERRIAAYITSASDAAVDTEKLRDFLRENLPSYMIPSAFIAMKNFPLTANGKVDLRALPSPEHSAATVHYLPPRNEIETRLVSIWKEILGVEQVGVRDDFFELGGHSLMAVSLFARIEQEFGQSLPLVLLFQNGTVETIAKALGSEEKATLPQGITTIQNGGSEIPLFIVSAGLDMREFLLSLAPGRPVYGLEPVENGKKVFRKSIQETAWFYYHNLLNFRPEGPYLLLGHSANGLFALELARLLVENGKEVGFLGMLDTLPPGVRQQAKPIDRLKIHLSNLHGKSINDKLHYIGNSLRTFSTRWQRKVIVETKNIEKYQQKERTKDENRNLLLSAYVPEPYGGKVTIFSASERPWYMRWDPLESWPNILVGPLDIVPIRGDHLSLLKLPQAAELAMKIEALLPHQNNG